MGRSSRQSLSVIGAVLVGIGIGLLLAATGLVLYDRLEYGASTRAPTSDSAAMIWPDGAPLTLMPPPVPTLMPPPVPTLTTTLLPSPPPQSTATMIPPPQPAYPVLLSIPKLKIQRTIVPVDRVTRDGNTDWDTDKLYATRDRPDLVGHLKGTGSLGGSGNLVLAGHNYNRGRYNWRGVFYGLPGLTKGDVLYVTNQKNERFAYQVVQTEQVKWPPRSAADMQKHIKHLTATSDETLTLVTCSGANVAPFGTRLYVTAKPTLKPVSAALPSVIPQTPATQQSPATATPGLTATAAASAIFVPVPTDTPQWIKPDATRRPEPTPAPDCRRTITVKRGDTLAKIARAHGVSMFSIAKRNGIANPNRIRVGRQLCIP